MMVHVSEYAYSSIDKTSIPFEMYSSKDQKHLLIFTGDRLQYSINNKTTYYMDYEMSEGHIKAKFKEDEFIDFYLVKDLIFDRTNNLMLYPIIYMEE